MLLFAFAVGVISANEEVHVEATSNSTVTLSDVSQPKIADSDVINQTTDENVVKPKIKTKVQADEKAVKYKKDFFFKIKVCDKNKTLLKNVKLKVKVKSGNSVKFFNIKTNSKGIAKFNTKGLKIGKHKVTITSVDENYTISKTSKIFVGKQ